MQGISGFEQVLHDNQSWTLETLEIQSFKYATVQCDSLLYL